MSKIYLLDAGEFHPASPIYKRAIRSLLLTCAKHNPTLCFAEIFVDCLPHILRNVSMQSVHETIVTEHAGKGRWKGFYEVAPITAATAALWCVLLSVSLVSLSIAVAAAGCVSEATTTPSLRV